jgi:hypothetical protein
VVRVAPLQSRHVTRLRLRPNREKYVGTEQISRHGPVWWRMSRITGSRKQSQRCPMGDLHNYANAFTNTSNWVVNDLSCGVITGIGREILNN